MHLSFPALSLILLSGFASAHDSDSDPKPNWQDTKVYRLPEGIDENSIKTYNQQQCDDLNTNIRRTAATDIQWYVQGPQRVGDRATWYSIYVPTAWNKNVDSPWVVYCQTAARHSISIDTNAFANNVTCAEEGVGKFVLKPNIVMDGGVCVVQNVTSDDNDATKKACGCKTISNMASPTASP